jgi:hypothetical protein
VTIYLQRKPRPIAEWLPKVQHLIGGVPLLLDGVAKLGEQAERPMAIVEIAVATVVVAAFVKELRAHVRSHGHVHDSFGWFDLAAGGLLIFEAFHGARTKPGYERPQFFSGMATIALGVFHARLLAFKARRRYLKLHENGLEFRINRFRRVSIAWNDLARLDLAGPTAVFHLKSGRCQKLRLSVWQNADEVRRNLGEHASAARVETDLHLAEQ